MADRFTVDVYVYRDGTITAASKDIHGLVVEATNTKEFIDELQWVSKDLLMANLGLDEARVQESTISLRWLNAPGQTRRTTGYPRVVMQEYGQLQHAA